MPHITILDDYNGEWSGLYIDGKLTLEGHSLQDMDVLKALAAIGLLTCDFKEATTEDRFPDNLKDAVLT